MNTISPLTEVLRSAIEHPNGGVVGVVDELLRLCPAQGLRLEWEGDRCRIRVGENGSEQAIEAPLRKSEFRAILARIAVLCNAHRAGSVSPYGGEGEIMARENPPAVFRVSFTNTPAAQSVALMRAA